MLKRSLKGRNPLTLESLQSLSKEELQRILGSLEIATLRWFQFKIDSQLVKSSQLDILVFWELYKRETAELKHQEWVPPDDAEDQAVDHDHARSQKAKRLGISKHALVLEKRRLKKEAKITKINQKASCDAIKHQKTAKQMKPRNTSSKIDVVDPEDVRWDVYQEQNQDYIQDYLFDLAQLPQDKPCERPDPWDLNLEPFLSDMYDYICGSGYDSD